MPTKTFLFVDQVGSTEQLTVLGDSAAHGIRRALFDVLRQATEVAGGQEVDFTGDGLFCAFDGAADAVGAAVAMQQLVHSFNRRRPDAHHLAVRIGLHTGEPLESEGGGWFGAAVVVAARLCTAASVGQVLCSELVRDLVEPRGTYRFESVGALDLKGVAQAVRAWAVVWAVDERPAQLPPLLAAARTSALVGRAEELQAVETAWASVLDGTRRLVLVSGDRGAGVTRLLAEAAQRRHDEGASVWAGEGQGGQSLLAPWAQAVGTWSAATSRAELRLALGDRAADLLRLWPGLADLVPRLPAPTPVEASAEVFLIGDALDEVMTRWSSVEPLVVVLDGLERADAATLAVLRRLATSQRGGRVLLLGGYEPSAVGTSAVLAALRDVDGLVDLRLGGLSADEVRELVTAVTGGPVDAATAAAVLGESDGSPWFVLQMARSLRERGLTREVRQAVDRAGELRTDLRLQREEIHLALRQLEQLRERPGPADMPELDPDGTPPISGTSPYRGLLPYQQEDAAEFHGRDALVGDMVATLLSSRWLAVVGPSGSGKSSAVRAGLLPAVAGGALPDSASWTSSVCTPGTAPWRSLAAALADAAGRDVDVLARRLAEEPWSALVDDVLGDQRLLLVVDQVEELWTSSPPAERARVLDLLVAAAADERSRVLVVVCLRADYYGAAAAHPAFAALVAGAQVLVAPMTASELRTAVERPALDAGLVLEPGLSQAVVDDVVGEPGALPLLSTAMAETWERRRGRSLTLGGYAETGGARRAIAGLAETTLAELSDQEQEAARRLLLRLAAPTAEGADVARPAPLAELRVDALSSRVLGHLAERRLVSVGENTARVAHEALLREWPRLRSWLEQDREGRRLHQQVAVAAAQWQEGGHDDGALLRGARLAAADDWRAEHSDELSAVEQEFLEASTEARQRELRAARRTTRRFQVLAGALVLLLVGVLAAAGLAVSRGREAAARATEATARGLAAQAIALTGTRLDTALLLAADGYRTDPSADTETGLLAALEGARHVAAYRRELSLDTVELAGTRDRSVFALLTQAGDLRLLDGESLRPLGEPLVRGVELPYSVGISPAGDVVGYGGATGVHLVDATTGEEVLPALGGGGFATLSFSDDGRAVVVAGGPDDPGITITELATGERLGAIPDEGFGQALPRPGTDEVLVAREEAPLQRYRFDGTAIGGPLPVRGSLAPMAYTPDGSRLVQSSPGGTTRVYDAETFEAVGEPVPSTGSRIVDLAVSPDGSTVALSGDDGAVQVAAVETGAVLASVEGLSGAHAVAFLDEHSVLASSQSQSVELDLQELTTIGASAALPEIVGHLAVLPDGETVLAGQGGVLVEVGPDGTAAPTEVELPVTVNGPLALSPDGTRVAVLGTPLGVPFDAGDQRQVVVADRRSGAVLARTEVAGDEQSPLPGRLAFSGDGRRLAVGTYGGVLTVLDSTSGEVLVEERVDEAAIGALHWSADDEVLYEGGQDGVLRLLDPDSAEVLEEVPLTPGLALSDVAEVPGTALLAVSSEAGEVLVVDPVRGEVVGERLSAEGTQLLGVAVSPDGERVAAITRDGSLRLRLWHRASGRLIGPALHGHRTEAFGIAWTDTGRLVTASPEGSVITWETEPRAWWQTACRLAGRDLTEAEWQRYVPERPYRRTCTGV